MCLGWLLKRVEMLASLMTVRQPDQCLPPDSNEPPLAKYSIICSQMYHD